MYVCIYIYIYKLTVSWRSAETTNPHANPHAVKYENNNIIIIVVVIIIISNNNSSSSNNSNSKIIIKNE